MAYHHRKLIQESINVSTSDLCPSFCSPENDSGFCPTPCLSLCSSICQYSLSALTSPPPSNHHPDKFHKYFPFLVVTLAVLAASFFLVCHYAIYVRFYSRRRSESQPQIQADDFDQTAHDEFLEEDHGPELDHPIWYIRTIGLQQSVINAIKICKYRKGEGLVEGIDCSVCLSEFEEDEVLRLLPKCNHAFHVPCIDTWLRSHTTCPMCRAGIVVNTDVVLSAPSPEINVDDLNNSDVNQIRNPENFGESRTERENESESSKEGEVARGRGRGINRIRRSVSVDSASVSMDDIPIGYEIDPENPPIVAYARLLRRRPEVNSMKRSLSCTGRKFLLSTRNNRNSLLPL